MGLVVLEKNKTLTQNKIFSFFYKAPEKGQQDCAGELTLSEDTADATVCWHYSTALSGCSGQEDMCPIWFLQVLLHVQQVTLCNLATIIRSLERPTRVITYRPNYM